MLFVFDTNTLISALLKPMGVPAQAYTLANTKGRLVFSSETAEEYLQKLPLKKFDKYVPVEQRILHAREQLASAQLITTVSLKLPAVCRDPKDIKFIELAIECNANAMVSGDADLLVLHPFRNVPIISPADFLKKF